ncbi:response regulator transcription factor [Salipiger marinus]|uniref:Two component transcriptional regulator, LuxR family n=1 Tax=Salipiger marinus TaxID=555512 RepID=A0A1G8PRN7_9RHOB|nr:MULTISPECIES: response regulator transcription factor [Salipiger]MCD1619415.1 response regulator transcription factor [Salipiger manganoxidans]MEB3420249.1 response regulator transcription factor [Salipiger manganoxidans]SDI95008.1 two component transcriptional regulator, LuxR family [Salipiger marinus]HBT02402.1 DNA-binding response regulator [Citreicella sp.]
MDHRATLLSPTGDSRALVVDDHPLFCDALTLTLQSLAGFARIDTAGTLERALELVSDGDPPHLVILDLTLPDVTGLDGLLRLRRAVPRAALLIVSSMADNRMVSHVMKAGADGFVPKHAQRSVFRRAFEAVARGEPFLPDGYIDPQAPGSGSGAAEALDRLATLTAQQARILSLLCEGKLNKQIAYELAIAETTVKAHVTAIMRKLGVHSRTQAVLIAQEARFAQVLPREAGSP